MMSEGAMTGKTEYASLLNKKFNEIKLNTVPEQECYIVKNPNALMNDYTKNISQSIFTPGVHKLPRKPVKLASDFK